MMPTSEELRRRARHIFDKHVLCYKCVTSNPMHKTRVPFVFIIQDISYGGLGIATDQMLHPDSVMSFRLDASDGNREFSVKVKWSRFNGERYVSGLEFLELVKEDIVFLHQIVNKLQ